MRDASHKQKMKNKYTGPYQITGISSNGQYYLKDKYSHQLKRPVPANKLICFYGAGGFSRKPQKVNVKNCENHSLDENDDAASESDSILCQTYKSESVQQDNDILSDSDSIQDDMTHAVESDSDSMHNTEMSDIESMQDSDVDSNVHNNNCQRLRAHCQPNKHKETKKENIVPSQITIMQSNDTPFSSDETVLDVGVDDNV